MAKQTFGWQVNARATATHQFNVRTVRFGEGYEQRQSQSLRPKQQTWEASKTGDRALIEEIKAFFDARRGVESFYWTPPDGRQLLVKVVEYREQHLGGMVWEILWKFEEVGA